ncbi:hypothetical protein Micbo1qcDRAFT_232804 [Microdochium bolleyi]|uniref:Ams2/SPT21 N-terminal domain-containing protein n=1 Tax=Microdochium bolleyi TaxID=196109 RepID=A0A136J7T3_9PEZI|nr:hypothetical protein Micbo1qcDRAFT_232804 [Microdochium bolleyi]
MADAEAGIQSQPMSLKIHYTFDKDSQERCLARWPHILNIQTIPVDERNTIGVIDLRTCLQAVAQCSPEITSDGGLDYTVYAFDYSEPDTPLVGQGMLSRGLSQSFDPTNAQPQLITGRVTRNLLAIFGNGVRETLEVRLKLTAVHRPAQLTQSIHTQPMQEPRPTAALNRSMSTMSEASEWNSFIHANPNLGRPPAGSATQSPALAPARPYNNNTLDARNEHAVPVPQMSHMGPSSRPSSAGPSRDLVPIQAAPPQMSHGRHILPEEGAPPQSIVKPAKTQSRPSSRASSRAPTGRPRGRPRKKPQPVEGHTSGYEDGTDADDGPPTKKRATTTKVERSNTATFGSAPDSLRVAASTSGSIRNFRPLALAGEAQNVNHLQEIPRAPTPVPIPRLPNRQNQKLAPTSSLRRESTSGSTTDRPFPTSYLELNRSATQNQDGRSPDSAAQSPFQIHSDEPSPAEIGSSPPVPRSALYSMRSSPAPSSPILPPMPAPVQQIDSGFMSGGIDDSRVEDDDLSKLPPAVGPQQTIVAKPKPKRSRSKKQPSPKETEATSQNKAQDGDALVIHTETPGPPELLPQTSLYNPPPGAANRGQAQRKSAQKPKTPVAAETPADTTTAKPKPPVVVLEETQRTQPGMPAQAADSVAVMSPDELASQVMSPEEDVGSQTWSPETGMMSQADFLNLEKTLMSDFGDRVDAQAYLDSFNFGDETFTPAAEEVSQASQLPFPNAFAPTKEQSPVPTTQAKSERPAPEPELPMIPASDPVFSHLSLPMPASEPAHPRTDAPEQDGRANKNFVKRQAIKQKLEEAIALGQMPTFCRNCGALQTPTWRKIWKQTRQGIPAYHEYSEKAGCVTAINILARDDDNEPTSYEMIKKALGPLDDKSEWTEISLCNPCGIWFSKWKKHRPSEKWEKDESRLNQTRKKRAAGSAPPRSKKARTKSDAQMGLTSEAGLPTDPLGPPEAPTSPKQQLQRSNSAQSEQQDSNVSENGSGRNRQRVVAETKCISTHSRGSGRAESPIDLDDGLGPTRRLLFPSPRKSGEVKTLGEVAVNIVQTAPDYCGDKMREGEVEKENQAGGESQLSHDEFADLFGPTPARPSTPPPKSAESIPFKTPTRPPSHRPVTRSVTHSVLRSGRSLKSPNPGLMLERTPTRSATKTPRSSARKRTQAAAHNLDSFVFDSPMTKSINQMLSEANGFEGELDLSMLNSDDANLNVDAHFDFSALLSTDAPMPSSPPMLRHGATSMVSFGGTLAYEDSNANIWSQITAQGEGEK